MSSDPPPDLPGGYKERMDDFVLDIMPIAEKIQDLCEEFGGGQAVLYGDELRVKVDRVMPEKEHLIHMGPAEANMIAMWRCHFGCSFNKIELMAKAVWGRECARFMAGKTHTIGQGLVVEMENILGLKRCESDDMELLEQICTSCNHIQMAITYATDTPKECSECGKKTCFNIALTGNTPKET